MTTQTNEAAERLNKWAPSSKADPEGYLLWLQTKQAALAAERRATVERINTAIWDKVGRFSGRGDIAISDLKAILDEEANATFGSEAPSGKAAR